MQPETENLISHVLKTLNKEYTVVGKARVRSWHAWLAIGLAAGILAGVLFVANRSGEFEIGLAQVLPTAPTSGLIAHWKFDEGSGTTVSDSSGNGNTGTLTNGPTFTTGKIGQGLSFDGINDAVQISDSNSLDVSQITVSAWVRKIYDAPSWSMIASRQAGTGTGDNWILFYNSSANDEYRFSAQGGTNIKLYRNGVQISDNAISSNNDIGQWVHIVGTAEGAIPPETSATCIGGGANNSRNCDSEYSNAVIYDVRIYNRALSASEILDIYNSAGSVKSTSSPTPTPTPNPTPTPTQTTTTTTGSGTLLQKSNLVYQGAFKVPEGTLHGATYGLNYVDRGFTYYPAHNSLFINNHVYEQKTSEISIPQIINSNSLNNLATATLLQNPADITEGNLRNIAAGGADYGETTMMGGLMVYNNKLIGTSYGYYDASRKVGLSHFTSGLTLSNTGDFKGMYKVGDLNPGFYGGYMTQIPPEWQSALGWPALTGQCCISIITRTSFGPAAFVFNPDDLGVKSPIPATPVVYYDDAHPTLGEWGGGEVNLYYNKATKIKGIVFPAGSRSVLFFGTQGTGKPCYGAGTSDSNLAGQPTPSGSTYCYDPTDDSKGNHAYPYEYWVWAYDVNDLISVKNGQKNPWDIRPYAIWGYSLPFGTSGAEIQGVAYDPTTQRLFISQSNSWDGSTSMYSNAPVINVFKVNVDTALDTTLPTISITSPASGATVSGTTNINATASDNIGVTKVEFYVDGVLKSTDTTSPYSYSWDTTNGGTHACNGAHTHSLTAKAYDAAGNPKTSGAISVNMNNPSYCATPTPTPTPTPTQTQTGNVYYVATNGNDANSGTQSSPFLTIQKAAGIASPGDTIIVKPGTYTNAITTNRGGTATSRIHFISEQKWGAKIKTSGVPYAWINNVNYINIEGFDISGDAKIGILNYASHVKVIGNHVHHLGRADCGDYGTGDMGAGIDTAGSGATNPRSATDNDIIGNVVHDLSYNCSSSGSGQHGIYHGYGSGIIANNIVYKSQSYGFHLYHGPHDVTVANNIAFNNRAAGIVVGGQDLGVARNIYVANNIFYDNHSYGYRLMGNRDDLTVK